MPTASRHRSALAVIIVAAALALSACTTPADEPAAPAGTTPAAPAETPAAPAATAPATGTAAATADALAERDAFIEAQQQPLGQPVLTAKTPAQIDLIAQQRAHVESQGFAWSETHETVTLALALDACETSILNGHQIDITGFRTHVTTSPLIAQLAATPEERESLVSVMVFGTGFLCPDDASQWQAAWQESAGQY